MISDNGETFSDSYTYKFNNSEDQKYEDIVISPVNFEKEEVTMPLISLCEGPQYYAQFVFNKIGDHQNLRILIRGCSLSKSWITLGDKLQNFLKEKGLQNYFETNFLCEGKIMKDDSTKTITIFSKKGDEDDSKLHEIAG